MNLGGEEGSLTILIFVFFLLGVGGMAGCFEGRAGDDCPIYNLTLFSTWDCEDSPSSQFWGCLDMISRRWFWGWPQVWILLFVQKKGVGVWVGVVTLLCTWTKKAFTTKDLLFEQTGYDSIILFFRKNLCQKDCVQKIACNSFPQGLACWTRWT